MIKYFRKKLYDDYSPEYWKNYVSQFEKKINLKQQFDNTEFVVLDVESTGLNIKTDKILSIGAVIVCNNEIRLDNVFELFIEQEKFNNEAVPIHGILKKGNNTKVGEENAMSNLLSYLGSRIIVGHKIEFDLAIINETLKRYIPEGKLLNKTLDTMQLYMRVKGAELKYKTNISLDDLSVEFNIPQSDRHNAAGDAYITSIIFLKFLSSLKKRGINTLSNLLKRKRLSL